MPEAKTDFVLKYEVFLSVTAVSHHVGSSSHMNWSPSCQLYVVGTAKALFKSVLKFKGWDKKSVCFRICWENKWKKKSFDDRIKQILALLQSLWLCEYSLTESVITHRRKEEAAKLILLPNRVDAKSADSDSSKYWQQKSFQKNTLMNNKTTNNFEQLLNRNPDRDTCAFKWRWAVFWQKLFYGFNNICLFPENRGSKIDYNRKVILRLLESVLGIWNILISQNAVL